MSTKIGTASNYLDLLDQLDAFLTDTGHAWGKNFTGVGNGDLVNYLGTSTSVAETITLTATNATTFTVVGSTSGALANATVGTPYTSARIAFTIQAGTTAFQAGDVFVINTSPKWSRLRAAGSADATKRTTNLVNVENLFDGNANNIATRAAADGFVEFEMHRTTEVREIVVQIYDYTTRNPRDFALQWKDNPGDAWTTAQSWTAQTWTGGGQSRTYTLASAPGAHKYWRFQVTAVNGVQTLELAELRLLEKVAAEYRVDEHAELVWRAPGLDGTKQIHVGLETYGSATADTFNLGFTGFRVFDDTKAVGAQPNGIAGKYLSLVNSPIGFWMVANGQRFILVTKAAGVYQTAYCGFGFPYEPPSVHAYPEIIGAASNQRGLRYNSTTTNFRTPMDPGRYGMAAFYPDAQWRSHANRYDTNGTPDSAFDSETKGKVWPAAIDFSGTVPSYFRDNLDGSRALLPCVLWHQESPAHVWGEFDGYFWTSGFGTVAEAIIREDSFDHLVVNNVFRVGVNHYAAVRLD